MVADVPTGPELGEILEIFGPEVVTVNATPLLACPATVTTTLPVVAPLGTGTTMEVAFQLVGVADVPLNFTVLAPCVEPKLVPVIVTDVPTGPDVGDRVVMLGVTVNETPLLARLLTVTTTFPVVAPLGTATTIEVALQLVGVAAVPLNFTVLVPWVAPKFVPVIVTDVPTAPDVGDSDVIPAVTVKEASLLRTPPTKTDTPAAVPTGIFDGTTATIEVLLQLLICAVVP